MDLRNPIKALQEAQERYGYLSKETLRLISHTLDLPLSKIYGVATFYHQFRLKPVGEYVVYVCKGTACHTAGKETITQFLRQLLGLKDGEATTDDGLFTIEHARCFGCCSLAPVFMIKDRKGFRNNIYGNLTPVQMQKILNKYKKEYLSTPRGVLY